MKLTDLSGLGIGQQVWYEPSHGRGHLLTVQKIGRKWVSLGISSTSKSREFEISTGYEKGEYGGSLWESEEACREWHEKEQIKISLQRQVSNAIYRASFEQTTAIAQILGIKQT